MIGADYEKSMHNGPPLLQIDAFTSTPWRGNPAAVCLLDTPRDDAWLQAVASEMNLSETAFLWRRSDGFDLRWFTPTTEVPLCGHATLASAHALWDMGELPAGEPARFHTKSGVLRARRDGEWIALDFPSMPPSDGGVPAEAIAPLGVDVKACGVSGGRHFIELARAADVRALQPDLRRLARVSPFGTIVTARADDDAYDFVSRFFAPSHGIDEDPVTGAAHCGLGPYWAGRLGKSEVVGFQASARGGTVRVRVAGPGIEPGRLELLGQAITVLRGALAASI
jgi:predicted PhzF superfamily epimerase YddE/YHI9